MSIKKPRIRVKNQPSQIAKNVGTDAAKGTTSTGKKVLITSGDKSSQVLAATVGGAVLGNLIAPGIGGAFFGGLVGAMLGNDSLNKGRK